MKKGFTFLGGVIAGATTAIVLVGKVMGKDMEKKEQKIDKFRAYYDILNKWLTIRQEGNTLEKYFLNQGYHKIAIYGMGELGTRLYEELKNTSITIAYAIDQNVLEGMQDLTVFSLEDNFEDVDAIVITPIFAYDEIVEKLSEKTNSALISLEDVVY